jgi:hypothetical protein
MRLAWWPRRGRIALLALLLAATPARATAATPAGGGVAATPAAGPSPTATAVPVTISGMLANGTAGGSVPAGMSVTATEVNAGATRQVAAVEVKAGPGNTFRATLPGEPGDQFAVSTVYLGVTYVAVAHPPTSTVLDIFETTTDNSVISVPAETLTVLRAGANQFNAIQLVRFANTSDRTYIGTAGPPGSGGSRQTVELPIPNGATNFTPGPGLQSPVGTAADGEPVASDPIIPGATDISYLYRVRAANSGWPLSRAVIYPTAREQLLLAPGLTATGPGLSFKGTVPIQNQRFADFQGGPLSPGTTVNADITLTSSSSPTLWIVLAILLVLVLVAGLVLPRLLRGRRRPTLAGGPNEAAAGGAQEAGSGEAERSALIDEVAALDEAHAAGNVADEEYAGRRAELKELLLALASAGAAGGGSDPEPAGDPEPPPASGGPDPVPAGTPEPDGSPERAAPPAASP